MRRLFVIFLLVIFPLQSVWAAVGSLCQHETANSAQQHTGHHAHQHQGHDVTEMQTMQAAQAEADLMAALSCPHEGKMGHGHHAGHHHAGHHEPAADQAASQAASQAAADDGATANTSGFDGDCGTCHLSCLSLVLLPPLLPAFATGAMPPAQAAPPLLSVVPSGPERPNWAPAV